MPSMEVKLKRAEGSVEGDKRQHIPYVLKWKCPGCGEDCEIDFTEGHYLSYPEFPGEKKVGLYCQECSHEETVVLKVDITAKLVKDDARAQADEARGT